MVQTISRPLSGAPPPRRPQKPAESPLGDVFNQLGAALLAPPQLMGGAAGAPTPVKTVPISPGAMPVDPLLEKTAAEYGLDPKVFTRIAQIESGGNPNAVTGSYRGLFQLKGGSFDPAENARAAAQGFVSQTQDFIRKYGRQPTAAELYMVHQQGPGGYAAHTANPDAPAWQNMASTAEGRQRGPQWARAAIWGNVPTQYRNQFGSVDNITSRQFLDLWRKKVGL